MGDLYSLSLSVVSFLDGEKSPVLILPTDAYRKRKVLERFAWLFKREMHFDAVQFEASEKSTDRNYLPYEGHLFYEIADSYDGEGKMKFQVFGACCFRERNSDGHPSAWTLDWVWFHPYFRGKGHLRTAWPEFQRRYGQFRISEPISCCMNEFLRKALECPPNIGTGE